MTASHRLIRCAPNELFAALDACCSAPGGHGSDAAPRPTLRPRLPHSRAERGLELLAGADRVTWEPPFKARLTSHSQFGEADLELTVDQGCHGSITHLRLEPTRGPSTLLRGPARLAYLTMTAQSILDALDSEVARPSAS